MVSVPIKKNGEPAPPAYHGPSSLTLTKKGGSDNGHCAGTYKQHKKAGWMPWFSGNRVWFYCKGARLWGCNAKSNCHDSTCSNLAGSCSSYQWSDRTDEGDLSKVTFPSVQVAS